MTARRLLALDLGTSTGWAYRRRNAGFGETSVFSGTQSFAPRRHDPPGLRFLAFRNWLTDMNADPFDVVYYEDAIRFLSIDPARVYFGMLATLQAWAAHRDIRVEPVNVSKLKKYATGNGAAKKPAMIAAAVARFGKSRMGDDEADALHLLGWAMDCEREK